MLYEIFTIGKVVYIYIYAFLSTIYHKKYQGSLFFTLLSIVGRSQFSAVTTVVFSMVYSVVIVKDRGSKTVEGFI